ncbi:MAG: MBL fold metallo-hydrolase [Alphaproteobacteria bacterium]|nr:MBL fold metallo-hydrolase [Pseudomonadota bacterium]
MTLPIAETWYESRPLENGISQIDELHIEPFTRSSIWLVEGSERDLLVDTGTGIGPLRATVAALTDRPVIAVATLGYYDHAGGLHQFDERALHRLDAHRLIEPTARKTVADKYVSAAIFRALPYEGFTVDGYGVPPTPITRLLEEGEVIELGDRRFRVLHLPGITDGSIGLYEEASGILFTGDTIVDQGGIAYDGEPPDYTDDADNAAYRRSLERVRSLDVATVYPGHFTSFGGERLAKIIDDYLAA